MSNDGQMSNTQRRNEILQRISENAGSEVLTLVKKYCALNYEIFKEDLVNAEDTIVRGKAQMCRQLVKDFTFM